MNGSASTVALLGAAGTHLGFQLSVTLLVYPALARVPGRDWLDAHAAHSRAITPLVIVVYGVLVLAVVWALVAGWPDAWTMVAATGAGVSFLATALVAAPTHGRLASGRDDALLRRLLAADRVRTLGAVVCCAAAAVAALT
jgi:hypothetical protein